MTKRLEVVAYAVPARDAFDGTPCGTDYHDDSALAQEYATEYMTEVIPLVRQPDALAVIAELERDFEQVASDRDIEKQLHAEWRMKLKELEAENARLRDVILQARHAMQFANDNPNGWINDTIWMMHSPETLFDFMDSAIDMFKNKPKIDTSAERVEKSAESIHVAWPDDDSRIDTIGQNGNTGSHYE